MTLSTSSDGLLTTASYLPHNFFRGSRQRRHSFRLKTIQYSHRITFALVLGKGSLQLEVQGFQDAICPDSIFKAFFIQIYALTAKRLPWIDISFVDMSPHTQWQNSNILQRDKLIGIQPTQKANRNERDPLIFPNIFFALFLKLLPIPLHQYFPLDIIKERLLYKSAISHPYPAM